jgi:thioredoxin reductase (NADPH)
MRGDVELCVSQHEKMRRKLARRDPVCDFHTEADERVLLAIRDPGRGIRTALRQSIPGRHLAFSQLRMALIRGCLKLTISRAIRAAFCNALSTIRKSQHKFGVETAIPSEVIGFDSPEENRPSRFALRLASGERVSARSIVIASGVNYRRLAVENLDIYESASVHYWASRIEARLCADQEVVLVGAGNSAGQAAVFLAEHVAKVWMLVRRDDIASTMSRYLVDRVSGLANVEVLPQTEVYALEGSDGILSAVHWQHTLTGEKVRRPARHLFLFIGADPNTGWLKGSGVALDPKGFVLTGADAGENRRSLETSRRGVYAIGDIRAGSTKRVAAAVGEGAQVVAALHAYLAAQKQAAAARAEALARQQA